jgi:predicted transposase YdaD
MEERRQLAMVDADIRTAMEAEKEFVQDYEYISAYDRQEKYERDRMAREDFVREEGEAIGEARGIAKAVNALRNKGKSDAAIAELLDMDVKEVQLIQ